MGTCFENLVKHLNSAIQLNTKTSEYRVEEEELYYLEDTRLVVDLTV